MLASFQSGATAEFALLEMESSFLLSALSDLSFFLVLSFLVVFLVTPTSCYALFSPEPVAGFLATAGSVCKRYRFFELVARSDAVSVVS